MGGSMSKSAAQQAVKVSARTVLARRAAEQQRPWAEGALRPLPHYHPNAPVATVGEEEQLMDPDLLKKIATTEMVKTKIETTTGDCSHLAVIIRQRKDEELLDLQAKDKSLVVGRGRLSEKDLVVMMERIRLNPDTNNPVEIGKKYNLGIHTVVQIMTSVRAPTVLSDADGNLYAV